MKHEITMVLNMSQKRNVLLILIVLLTTPMAVAQTITVDATGNADYTSIGDAVANAETGDTIRVMPGVYSENIKVDKQVNLVAEYPCPDRNAHACWV